MTRLRYTAAIFILAGIAVLGGMGWVTLIAVRVDDAEFDARRRAATEESVRLALWRLDTAVAPLIVQESIRPFFEYSPFYSAERAYTKMFAELSPGEVLVPSPLLTFSSPYIRLHFEFTPAGILQSPQAPTNMRDLTEANFASNEQVQEGTRRLDRLTGLFDAESFRKALAEAQAFTESALTKDVALLVSEQSNVTEYRQRLENDALMKQAPTNLGTKTTKPQAVQPPASLNLGFFYPFVNKDDDKAQGMQAVWVAGELYLGRIVRINGEEYLQGCWMNWPELEKWLLESCADLLPNATLTPVTQLTNTDPQRMLASLPVRLVENTVVPQNGFRWSPIRAALAVAWACVLLAGAAVAALLGAALTLAERRAAFVSAVTHELRTPLTTFRMYTDLLSGGVIKDEARRQQYLLTLSRESARLAHLVENVLSYARLERGRNGARHELIGVADLAQRMRASIEDRCHAVGATVHFDIAYDAAAVSITTNVSAVEQIVMNLVDNACKYGRSDGQADITVAFTPSKNELAIAVSDQGPGMSSGARRALFRPFSKSARQAAESAPGVGLGLALSRRIARSLGGELALSRETPSGCRFVLTLPANFTDR